MEIIYKNVDEIIPYENNPRKNDDAVDYVAKSIEEFGFKVPIIIDKNNVIVTGHTRLKAAKKLGLEEVPTIKADDLTEEQIKAFRLADNKVSEYATWDDDLLNIELKDLDIDMSNFGFDMDFDIEEEQEVVEDEVPEVPEEPKAKLGDIYQLGNHRLMCGDSTSEEDVTKLMNENIASIEITSPPYNVGESSKLNCNTKMKESKYISSDDNIIDYKNLIDKTTINGINNSKFAFINLQMLSNNKIDIIEYMNKYKDYLCDIGIWNKGFGVPAMAERVMNSAFEFVFIFSKINNSRAIGTKKFRGNIPNIFDIPPQRKNEFSNIHAATFPIEFPTFFIKNFTNENENVLDLFGGTGTTLIACEQLNRKCYMMELDPHYIDVIIQRWENFTGEKAALIERKENE
jgi:site-specific DNA-methyltransferase (adenine-specific)